MNDCPRPLDPMDCEALASGEAPELAADAASHAGQCPACRAAVESAGAFLKEIELQAAAAWPSGERDLAGRVIRIRPFSRRERRDWRLWSGPAALSGAVFAAGIAVLAAPGLSARDQAGVTVAALAPLAALARASWRALADGLSFSPGAWTALSETVARESSFGLLALLLLAPAGLALRRVLARAPRRDGRS